MDPVKSPAKKTNLVVPILFLPEPELFTSTRIGSDELVASLSLPTACDKSLAFKVSVWQ